MSGEIIGRDAELVTIQAFLDRTDRGATALVLEGEAGIGKSTLWLAAVEAARSLSLRVLLSRPAEAEQTLPNVVLGDLFRNVEPAELAALPVPRRRAIEAALLLADEPVAVDPRTLSVAILTLLPLLAAGRPLVLAIDDDQWLDTSSRAALGFALRRLQDHPLRLLLARRPRTTVAELLEDALDRGRVERLDLGPVSRGAIEVVVHRQLDITLSRPALARLHEASGGNPFYAVELARAQLADPTRTATAPLAVPPSLERLVGARLDALGAPTRRALLLIAAHGRVPVGLLRTLHVAPAVLDPARVANVIETADAVVRFTHPLLASTLYQESTSLERRSAHRRLAAAFDDPVDRGRHLALGTEAPDNELAAKIESAAGEAGDRGMPAAAAELAEHAFRLTPMSAPDDRERRAISAARAQLEAGDATRARAIAADVLASSRRGSRRAEALMLISDLELPGSAAERLQEALVEAAGEPALEATIHAGLAERGRFTKGRVWAERHARTSLQLAEQLDDDGLRAHALSVLAPLLLDRGDPSALNLAERAYLLAVRLAVPAQMKRAGLATAYILTWSGETELARDWLERQLIDWADRDERARSKLVWHLALVELWAGRWSIASEHAAQVREISEQYGEDPTDHLPPALIALYRGQLALARAHSQRAVSLARGQFLPTHLAVLAICDLQAGDAAAALAHFADAEQAADARGLDEPFEREWRAEYAEALLQLGRVEDAAELISGWETAATRLRRGRVLAQTLRCRGQIAAARGDLPASVQLLEDAADRAGTVGDPFGLGRALLALGIVRRRARQKRSARMALEAALASFESLGAASWAGVVRAELARIGGRQRIEGLSPSEERVAALVAEGRTNREIATILFLGPRTVASHLTHIYSKLGVRSRTELARHLHAGGGHSASDAGKVPTS